MYLDISHFLAWVFTGFKFITRHKEPRVEKNVKFIQKIQFYVSLSLGDDETRAKKIFFLNIYER